LLAWGWLLVGSGMESSAIEMTAMAGMDGWLMQPAIWTTEYAFLIFFMWWVMMVAMMLPSATPALLLFDRVSHSVLLTHEDKTYDGAVIASLSIPWG